MALTEEYKKQNLRVVFFIWFKSAEYNGINRSSAIKSLQSFLVSELNWDKKHAGERILEYFREHQTLTPDELITVWEQLRE